MTTPKPLELIAQAEELLQGTTPGEWAKKPWINPRQWIIEKVPNAGTYVICSMPLSQMDQSGSDADFIVFAHNNLPALLAAFREVIIAGNEIVDIAVNQCICELLDPSDECSCDGCRAIAKWDALTGKAKA